MAKAGDFQWMGILGRAALAVAASGNLLEIQSLASPSRLTESESVGVVSSNLGLTSCSSYSDAQLKFEDHKVNDKN